MLVEGRLKFDQWSDQNGQKRSKHSVTVDTLQMLGSRDENQSGGGQPYTNNAPSTQRAPEPANYQQEHAKPEPMREIDIDSDDIPF